MTLTYELNEDWVYALTHTPYGPLMYHQCEPHTWRVPQVDIGNSPYIKYSCYCGDSYSIHVNEVAQIKEILEIAS